MNHKNMVWYYVAGVFILSYLWQMVIYFTGGVESGFFPFVMLFPGLVAVGFRLFTREGFRNVGWGLKKWWYMLPAIFVPVGLTLGIIAVLIVFDRASLTGLTFSGGMLVDARFTLMLGKHTQSIPFFALNLTVSYLWACLVGCIFTIGEEFGWQGYLNQKLLSRFGLNWGLILLGIIWGYWHMPIILMGYNFPTHPILGALVLMPIGTIFLGIFQAWLYLRSRSIWMPVLFHASGNAAAGFLFGGMTMRQGQDEILMALLWIVGWGIVAAFSLVALNLRQPKLWQEGGEPVVSAPTHLKEPVLEV